MNEMRDVPDEDLRAATRADVRPDKREGFYLVSFENVISSACTELLAVGVLSEERFRQHVNRWRTLRASR